MFNSYDEGINSSEKIKAVNKLLRQEYNTTAFIYRLAMKRLPKKKFPDEFKGISSIGFITMPYYSYHCSKKLKYSDINKIFGTEFQSNWITPYMPTKGKIYMYCQSIKSEKPHNITSVAGESGKRYGVLNRKQLVPDIWVDLYKKL